MDAGYSGKAADQRHYDAATFLFYDLLPDQNGLGKMAASLTSINPGGKTRKYV
jgi:hypothetical protein